MKKCVVVLVLLVLVAGAAYSAEPITGVGTGITLGLPLHVGATAEYNFGPAYAGLSLGYFGMADSFWMRLEGGYNVPGPFVSRDLGVDLYLSVGGYIDLMFSTFGTMVGIGIPVTWSYTLETIPLKFFVKAGPEFLFGGGMGFYPAFVGTAGGMYVFQI
ncbi:MAG: hypothetical protein RBS49_04195 [Sphaerochaeta sp.]|nr:hypothetical protein [Sphaerochaeta sp.]